MILTTDSHKLAQIDTINYRNLITSRGGTISNTELTNLYNFAKELYSLVGRQDFWTLRSGQNAGSGTKSYSFQGVEGKLENGPTWNADGMLFTRASNQRILYPNPKRDTALTHFFGFSIINNSTRTVGTMVFCSHGESGGGNGPGLQAIGQLGWEVTTNTRCGVLASASGGTYGQALSNASTGLNAFTSFAGLYRAGNPATANVWINAVSSVPATSSFNNVPQIWNNNINWSIGANTATSPTYGFDGYIPFVMAIFNQDISTATVQKIYSLYKSTIGQGLSLP